MVDKLPEVIHPLVALYLEGLDCALAGLVEGVYLHGSIALGAFDDRRSDVDFITVLQRPLASEELSRLSSVHDKVARRYPRWEMDGSYLQWGDLGRFAESAAPHPYYHAGVLHPRGHHELNIVAWWVLGRYGIAVRGPEPGALAVQVEPELLVEKVAANLNTYWVAYTRVPWPVLRLLSDEGIQWMVLGVLRQYYTFREHDITSKSGAGRYALTCLPRQWHRIVREALNLREGEGERSLYRTRFHRAVEAYRFLQYVIATSNVLVAARTGRITSTGENAA